MTPRSAASPAAAATCDRRADVEALRQADDTGRKEWRGRLDDEVAAADDPRARVCAAAVAAAAATLDGDKARTLQLLDDVVAGLPALAADLRPRRALLLAELGHVEVARRELALIDERSGARDRIELAIADATQDLAIAQPILRRLAARDVHALARLCRDGDPNACRDVLVRHPRSTEARQIELEADDGRAHVIGRTAAWSAASLTARVRALTGAARPHRAVTEGRAWLEAHRPAAAVAGRAAVAAALGEALLRTGDAAAAVDVTAAFAARSIPAKDRAAGAVEIDASKVHAKALSRLGRVDDAVAAWRALADVGARGALMPRVAGADTAAEAAFFGAFTLVEADRIDEALIALDDARQVTSAASTPAWETQRAWYAALLLLTARHDASSALPILDALAATRDREARKFRYWRARALRELGRTDVGDTLLRALLQEDPLDWYGQLARRDLGRPPLGGAPVAPDALAALARRAARDDDAVSTQLLWQLGFDDEAHRRCRGRAQRARPQPSLVDVGVCQLVGDATSGWRRGALFAPRIAGDALPIDPAWRVSFAAPWTEAVDDVAAAAAVPRSFVWAIMRTESGFDPAAVSVAGARGALQLLPSVARGVAEGHGLASGLAERLDDPHVAVALGGRLLGLLAREHGSLLIAAAAYNGAPENAVAWVRRYGALPADVFVERIPFKETRDYVKRVLAVEAVYRGLDGEPATLALPATLAPTPAAAAGASAAAPTLFPYRE